MIAFINPLLTQNQTPYLWIALITLITSIAGTIIANWLSMGKYRRELSDKKIFEKSLEIGEIHIDKYNEILSLIDALNQLINSWSINHIDLKQVFELLNKIETVKPEIKRQLYYLHPTVAVILSSMWKKLTLLYISLGELSEDSSDLTNIQQLSNETAKFWRESISEIGSIIRLIAEGKITPRWK